MPGGNEPLGEAASGAVVQSHWMPEEFRDFAIRGDVTDMGAGLVSDGAFTTDVTSFVEDIVNPVIGLFAGGIGFSGLCLNLSGREVASAAPVPAPAEPPADVKLMSAIRDPLRQRA